MSESPIGAITAAVDVLRPLLNDLPVAVSSSPSNKQFLLAALQGVIDAVADYFGRKKRRKGAQQDEMDKERSDWLDSEGVQIWSTARGSAHRANGDGIEEDPEIQAALRLCAFKLVEAASGPRPAFRELIFRNLNMACRTASAMIKTHDVTKVQEILVAAADYELAINEFPPSQTPAEAAERLGYLVDFTLARVDAAVSVDNHDSALSFVRAMLDHAQADYIKPQELSKLASKCWQIGDDLRFRAMKEAPEMKSDAAGDHDATIWVQQGLDAVQKIERLVGPGQKSSQLKAALLRSLAKAHLDTNTTEGRNAAQAVLQDLESSFGMETYVHDIAKLHFHIGKATSPEAESLEPLLEDLVTTTEWTEDGVTDVLKEIHSLTSHINLVYEGTQLLVRTAASCPEGLHFVPQILLTTLVSLKATAASKLPDAAEMARNLLDVVGDGQLDMYDRVKTSACATMLWHLAQVSYEAEKFDRAADWYSLSQHPALGDIANDNHTKAGRKIALSLIKARHYDRVAEPLRSCDQSEAATHYLWFLHAVHTGNKAQAMNAVNSIIGCADLHGSQILLMVSVAQERGFSDVLSYSLAGLLHLLQTTRLGADIEVERFTLIRTLIRMTYIALESTKDASLIASLRDFVAMAQVEIANNPALIDTQGKAVSWLYKTAFNAACKGCADWPTDLVTDLFEHAAMIMTTCQRDPHLGGDPHLATQKAVAQFGCLNGKFYVWRSMIDGPEKDDLYHGLVAFLPVCRQSASDIPRQGHQEKIGILYSSLTLLEAELLCDAQDWAGLELLITLCHNLAINGEADAPAAVTALEGMSGLLLRVYESPRDLAFRCFEIVTQISSLVSSADVARFAGWIRIVFGQLRSADHEEDERRAYDIVERAVSVIKSPQTAKMYPSKESQWLMTETWNLGLERYDARDLQSAKVWCEKALQISAHAPQGQSYQAEMQRHYQNVLAQISQTRALITYQDDRSSMYIQS